MHNGRPLFPGSNDSDQLESIFKALGTPDESVFAGVDIPETANNSFKRFPTPESFAHLVPGLNADGVDLLSRMLRFDPNTRISARETLEHPFFADLPAAMRVAGINGGPL